VATWSIIGTVRALPDFGVSSVLPAQLPGFYDIALRDFGLLVAAVALGRLATVHARADRIGADR
jgi:hypothetical protein